MSAEGVEVPARHVHHTSDQPHRAWESVPHSLGSKALLHKHHTASVSQSISQSVSQSGKCRPVRTPLSAPARLAPARALALCAPERRVLREHRWAVRSQPSILHSKQASQLLLENTVARLKFKFHLRWWVRAA